MGSDTTLNATFALKPLLTVSATTGGRIVTDPSGRVDPNNTYTALAENQDPDNYRFAGWYSNNLLVSTDLEVSIQVGVSDVSYEARFVSKWHTLNYSLASGSVGMGTVGAKVSGVEVESGFRVKDGEEVVLTCSPKVDYRFVQWDINGRVAYALPYSFIVSGIDDATITCQAQLAERGQYSIFVSKVDGNRGSVELSDAEKSWSESGGAISATGHSGVRYTVAANVVSSLSATGRELNKFVGFTKDGVALASREVTSDYRYEANFTNGQNMASETLDDVDIVASFAQKSLYHAELNIPVSVGGTASIVPEPDMTTPNDRWLEGTITAVATPNEGYYVGSFNVVDVDYGTGGHVVQPQKDADGKYRDSFTLNFNARITVNFLKIPCRPYVSVHSASAAVSAGTATVRSTAQGGGTDTMVYGDIAIFAATSASGYSFGGWFDEDGNPVPDSTITTGGVSTTYTYQDAEYRMSLTGDVRLVARFSAQVSLSASSTASASGSVSIDSGTAGGTATKLVMIGDTCDVSAIPGEGSFFGSWFLASDTSFASPLDIAANDTIVVSDTIDYVARFISEQDYLCVALCNYDNETEEPDASLGNLVMTTFGPYPAEATSCTETEFLERTEMSAVPGGVVKLYKIPGTARMSLTASSASGRGFGGWTFAPVSGGSEGVESPLSESSQTSVVVNRHMVFRAHWGDLRPSRLTVRYALGNNITNGKLKMDGIAVADETIQDKTETDEATSATFTQGDLVSISIDIKNGFVFDGWFYDAECSQPLRDSVVGGKTYRYTDAEYRFFVSSPVTICAKFKQDANAIYCWEGSADPKMMTWKSKVYVSNKPFDPVAVRVDSTGYADDVGNSLSVSVGMFSSPDALAKPSSVRTLQIRSQDSRRLPRKRPERYMQIQVDSNCEVDAMFIGTSMGGLAI